MSPVVLALALGSAAGALPSSVQATDLQPFPVMAVYLLRVIPLALIASVAFLGAGSVLLPLLGLATLAAAAAFTSCALLV